MSMQISATPMLLCLQFLRSSIIILSLMLLITQSSTSSKSSLVSQETDDQNIISRQQYLQSNHDKFHHFRMLNRRKLLDCHPLINQNIVITTDVESTLSNEQYINVTVSGVVQPSELDWVAMITPSHSSVENCPFNTLLYKETGDLSDLPLLCHYPVKASYLRNDPNYLQCQKRTKCTEKGSNKSCVATSCSASLIFHVINIRTDIEFVAFGNGFISPCILGRSKPFQFSTPHSPLYAHLSSIDSTGTKMRVTWVSGSNASQHVQYGNGMLKTSTVTSFTRQDMCGSIVKSPAQDFGWHDPGYIHSAILTNLQPSTTFSFKYGSGSVGWSDEVKFRTPPAGGSNESTFIAYGDMGKAPRDATVEHFIQPGSLSVASALIEEVFRGNIDSIFHIGDISYATGFLVEWDYFLHLITPFASRISYMTTIGNHERDYIDSGSVYITPDSGGECGVPYETYFQMPTKAKDKPWYSIEQGPIHFTVISTEHHWSPDSEQYDWMKLDMASIDRSKTPWLIFTGHRPMYTSSGLVPFLVDSQFVQFVEPLLLEYKVDLVLVGHVHNYQRTCALYKGECKAKPVKDDDGIDTYNNTQYAAPVHVVIGMAGFRLDQVPNKGPEWSLSRISEYGYTKVHATMNKLKFEFIKSNTKQIGDSFQIIK